MTHLNTLVNKKNWCKWKINLAHSELISYVSFMYLFTNRSLKMTQFWVFLGVLTALWLDIRGSLCYKRGVRRLSTDSIHPYLYTTVTGKRQGKCSGKQRRHNQISVLSDNISNYMKLVLLISLFKKMYVYLKQIVSNICTIKHFLKLQWRYVSSNPATDSGVLVFVAYTEWS